MYNKTILNLINGSLRAREQMYYFLRQEWPQINERTTVQFTDRLHVDLAQSRELPMQAYKNHVETWGGWWRGLFPLFPVENPEFRWQYQRMVVRSLRRIPVLIWKWITGKMHNETLVAMPEPEIQRLRMKNFQVHEHVPGSLLHKNIEYYRLTCVYSPELDRLFVFDAHNGAGRLRAEDRDGLRNYLMSEPEAEFYTPRRYQSTRLDPFDPDVEAALREALRKYKKS